MKNLFFTVITYFFRLGTNSNEKLFFTVITYFFRLSTNSNEKLFSQYTF